MITKHPPGPAMTLGNMRGAGRGQWKPPLGSSLKHAIDRRPTDLEPLGDL